MPLSTLLDELTISKTDKNYHTVLEKLNSKNNNSFNAFITKLKVGKSTNIHFHKNEPEYLCISEGLGLLRTMDIHQRNTIRSQRLSKGKLYKVKPRVAHEITNIGKIELSYFTFCEDRHLNDDFHFKFCDGALIEFTTDIKKYL